MSIYAPPLCLRHNLVVLSANQSDRLGERLVRDDEKTPSLDIRTLRRQVAGLGAVPIKVERLKALRATMPNLPLDELVSGVQLVVPHGGIFAALRALRHEGYKY